MGKPANKRRLADNEAMAIADKLRVSQYKLNGVARVIRGMPVQAAMDRLAFLRRGAAGDVRKTLSSAISNAENNHGLDVDSLVVAEAHTGKSLTLKRWRPRARGRAFKIIHPFSRVTIIVREDKAQPKAQPKTQPRAAKKAKGKAKGKAGD